VPAPTTVHIKTVLKYDDQALAGVAFTVDGPFKAFPNVEGKYQGTTDGDGAAEFDVVSTVEQVAIEVPSKKLRLPIWITSVPDSERVQWAFVRLTNLGYIRPIKGGDRKTMLGHALRRFQSDEGIAVNGELNSDTWSHLRDIHGV
jgi:hypothetical protein